jgi:hypothetical protein
VGDNTREEELRQRLARHLKRPTLPDPLWAELLREGYVAVALEGGAEDWADLVRVARRYLRLARQLEGHSDRPGRAPAPAIPPSLVYRPEEEARIDAISEYVAAQVKSWPDVRHFRERVLGGRLLTSDQVEPFYTSPALAFVPRHLLESWGFLEPVLDVEAEWAPGGDPTKRTRTRTLRLRRDPVGPTREVNVPIGPDEQAGRVWLTYVGPDRRAQQAEARWYSVLGEFQQVCERMARALPWDEAAAGWFVLTGQAPLVEPIHSEIQRTLSPTYHHVTITMTIEPWFSARSVLETYRALQLELLGRDNRPIGARALALLRFVGEHLDERGRRPTWEVLRLAWNQRHPEWAFADVRSFARAVGRAEREVLYVDAPRPERRRRASRPRESDPE